MRCVVPSAGPGMVNPEALACPLPNGSFVDVPCTLSRGHMAAVRSGRVFFNVCTSAHPTGACTSIAN